MNAFRFQSPLWFIALICLLPVVVKLLRLRRRQSVTFSSLTMLDDVAPSLLSRLYPFVSWLRVIGLTAVVIGLARPQEGIQGYRERRDGIGIQICLDRSTSMSAEDFELNGNQVSRLDAVKDVIRRFVVGEEDTDLKGREDDQVGLVAFGGFAEVRCPATLDHGVFEELLSDVKLPEPVRDSNGDIIQAGYQLYRQEGATAIGDALALSADQLRRSQAKSKVIILLSDGEHNAGVLSPDQAIEVAKEFGIRVYSIGVGSSGRRFIRDVDMFGKEQYVPMNLRLDEDTLREIADETGGRYFHADNTDGLLGVYREINQLEKTSTEGTVYREYRELCFSWFLAGLLLIVSEVLLRSTLFRGVP